MVVNSNTHQQTIYYQMNTTNKSFLEMHYYLRSIGIKNNRFFLALYDPDLNGVDPRDPRLNQVMKAKILRECTINFWYFIREVVLIPDEGGAVGGGKRYQLHRGNLSLNFGFLLNWNMFLELPRQHGKTISAICWYLWVYNFGTTNSELMFMNKKADDSKLNLRRLKDIRDALPTYLQMKTMYSGDKKLKGRESVESIENFITHNKVVTKPGARSRQLANGLGRGCTMPVQWYDEYAFILYNSIIYGSATPAYRRAADNAKRNGKPYGILITTTPGDTTTEEGLDAMMTKDAATPFSEKFYDFTMKELIELQNSNPDSNFFYMRFTYQQLGSGEEYFKQMVKDLKKDWPTIRREVLLEWAQSSNNSPFRQQDLETVGYFIKQQPIQQLLLCKYYTMNIYKKMDVNFNYPVIIGVDVSGGYKRDSSAITIIDSKTTEVVADLNCNYISTEDLAKVIYELVTCYLPNAIVNIERNGGFGHSVLTKLMRTKIKKNLYWEIKDKVEEERYDGVRTIKKMVKKKVYGFDETKNSREELMEILRDRMENHKAKFISPIIYDELKTLEVKKNGRIEHASNAHDDQIFSYLMALYVWYNGKNLAENFGLNKGTIRTDDDTESDYDSLGEESVDISSEIESVEYDEEVEKQLRYLKSDNTMLYKDWVRQQEDEDARHLANMRTSKVSMKAYIKKYSLDEEQVAGASTIFVIPDSVFNSMYVDEDELRATQQKKEMDNWNNIMID